MKDICALPSCGKELTHTEGRRKKKYCDAACKMKHWAERNKSYVPKRKHIKREDWEKIQNEIALAKIKLKNSYENPMGIFGGSGHLIDIEAAKQALIDESSIGKVTIINPKNLDQLKSMCPPELTGIDRSAWISEKRVEYGI